ncbi:hypothetical protein [Algoriphagus boritolerans]|uniref:Outer membrane protein beta-barrel domain-containing protein n=1 Tax=Algoriphagus boritolerans DSM 17298 = JCM 18970 TaxID=1120964 RepID=A0A1H5VYV3_9BACT|nr:hypothetical protein [Algoriphagus boritolerans]SEF92176.1 hypothetical protein SAMN03080598_01878 [Algoriphagus boritolerans DSM 17298 = JCM 18970]
MNKFFLSLIFLLILNKEVFSQEKLLEKLELGLSGGLAVPVGNFSAVSIAPSLEPTPPGSNPIRFQGFLKNEGGQAEIGYSLGMNLTFHATPSLFVSFNYLQTQHSIDTRPQQIFYDANFKTQLDLNGNEFDIPGRLESDPYRANLFYMGLGYRLPIHRVDVRISALVGINNLEFPFYSWFFQISETTEIYRRPFPVDGPVPTNLKEFAYGLEAKIVYPISPKLNLNLATNYLRSDHPHGYWTDTLAASLSYQIDDEIRYRNLAVQFGISYRFGSN